MFKDEFIIFKAVDKFKKIHTELNLIKTDNGILFSSEGHGDFVSVELDHKQLAKLKKILNN